MAIPSTYDLLGPADEIKTFLEADSELSDVTVLVDRQTDLQSRINKATAKSSGAALLIALDGWGNIPKGSGAKVPLRFSISLWTRPVIKSGDLQATLLIGYVIAKLHAWTPNSARNCTFRVEAGAGSVTITNRYKIHEFPVLYEIVLSSPD